jgi:hypothetical protein
MCKLYKSVIGNVVKDLLEYAEIPPRDSYRGRDDTQNKQIIIFFTSF